MAVAIEIGYLDRVYGTIRIVDGQFIYDGQRDILERMVLLTQRRQPDLLPEQVLDILLRVMRRETWARQVDEKHLAGQHNQESHGHRGGAGLANAVVEAGGFTYNPHGREHFPATGLALSIYPERSVIITDRAVTRDDLRSFINKNEDLLADKSNYFGAWNDKEHGRVFLDISKVVQNEGEAKRLCEEHGQRAYFNLETFETVEVVPEAEAHKQAAPKKIEVVVVPRDATDEELDAIIALLNKA